MNVPNTPLEIKLDSITEIPALIKAKAKLTDVTKEISMLELKFSQLEQKVKELSFNIRSQELTNELDDLKETKELIQMRSELDSTERDLYDVSHKIDLKKELIIMLEDKIEMLKLEDLQAFNDNYFMPKKKIADDKCIKAYQSLKNELGNVLGIVSTYNAKQPKDWASSAVTTNTNAKAKTMLYKLENELLSIL